MKKLAAILAMCIVMTSALVSCGDSDDSSSAKTSTTTTTTDETSSDENDTTKASKAEDGTDDSSEASTGKEDVTDDATKASKELPTGGIIPTEDETTATVDTSDFKGGDIVGSWIFDEEGVAMVLTFNEDMSVGETIDFSSMIKINGTKVVFGDGDFSQDLDVTFDGKVLKAAKDGEDYLALERISGETDKDNLDGTYKITGGILEAFASEGGDKVSLKVENGKTYIVTSDFAKYEVNGSKLKLTKDGDDESDDLTFNVDGDTLTIVEGDGEATILKRD